MKMNFWKKLGYGFACMLPVGVFMGAQVVVSILFALIILGAFLGLLLTQFRDKIDIAIGNIYNIDAQAIEENLQALIYGLTIVAGIISVLFLIFVYKKKCKYTFEELGRGTLTPKNIILAVLTGLACMLTVHFLFDAIGLQSMDTLTRDNIQSPVALFAVIIMAPVTEELVFRGFMFSKMLEKGVPPYFTIAFTGIIFGLVHGDLLQISYAVPFGIIMGLFRYKYNNLWLCMVIHSCANYIGTFPIAELGSALPYIVYSAPVLLILCLIILIAEKNSPLKKHLIKKPTVEIPEQLQQSTTI